MEACGKQEMVGASEAVHAEAGQEIAELMNGLTGMPASSPAPYDMCPAQHGLLSSA